MLHIKHFLKNIDIGKSNKTIKEFSIQLQFFTINIIKSIISHNLLILGVREVDIYTLNELRKYICSYAFLKNLL